MERWEKSLYDTDRTVVSGLTFELGNGKNYLFLELVEKMGDTEVESYTTKTSEVRVSLNEDTKVRDMLGWKPKGDILRFIKENYV